MTDSFQQYMALNAALMTGLAAIERVAWNPGASVLNYISPLLAGAQLAAQMIEAGDDASKYIYALGGTYAVGDQPSREQLDSLTAATNAERERRSPKEPTPEDLTAPAEQPVLGEVYDVAAEPTLEASPLVPDAAEPKPAVEPVVPIVPGEPERKPLE